MKALLFSLFFISLGAQALERVPLMSGKLYIPKGYDANDLVEVVVSGRLPDLCHRNPTYEIVRDAESFNIHLFAYYVPNPEGCREISITYQDTVALGILPEGKYKVALKKYRSNIDVGEVDVAPATSSLQDEFNYGNVMGISEDEAGRGIELSGTNPLTCLKFEKLETEIQQSVIVLRPRFREEGPCLERPTPFTIKYEVPYLEDHPRGMLLHVRVMDGRSFNYLYQNRP